MSTLKDVKVVTVSVDYHAELRLVLKANLEIFKSVYLVVTSPGDKVTQSMCSEFEVPVYVTDSFYAGGAVFNKWKALEEGLDQIQRSGWIAIIDSDIVFPFGADINLERGNLYTPERKILLNFENGVPSVDSWSSLPGVGHYEGFPGYVQIFHADDAPKETPWHRVDLGHAGCADTWFEEKWEKEKHIHPDFNVVHLGEPFKNWVGRRLSAADREVYLRRAYKGKKIFL